MKYLFISKLIILITMAQFLLSCSSQSEFFRLYSESTYNNDIDLILRTSDSSYVYSNTLRTNWACNKEIGYWKETIDTLFLFPKVMIYNDSCTKYNPNNTVYATLRNDSIIEKSINYRVYLKGRDGKIKDHTIEYHFPNDSNAFSWNENFPLQRRKILQSKREKSVLYSRKVIDRIW